MYRGYVKLWRKLEDSDIFKNEKALKIWIWILIRANHKENTVLFGRQKIDLKPGEFIMGLNRASEHLGLAKSTIHFWVNYLNQSGMIELKKTNKFSLIKVKNWLEYQDTETQTELKKNSKKTLKETDKNEEGMKKNEETNIYSEPSSQIQEIFKMFYDSINKNINFGNTTQRKAVEEMIRINGFEAVQKVTLAAIQAYGQKFAPVITTPSQLKEKWSALAAWYKNQQTNSPNIRSL